MASITRQPNGRRTIQFIAKDGKRRSIRLGKVDHRMAQQIKWRVEELNAAAIAGQPPSEGIAGWLVDLDRTLYDKLVKVGLVKPRGSTALLEFCNQYIETRTDVKATTVQECYIPGRDNLVAFFGGDTDLRNITPGQCDEYRLWLLDKYAAATASRRLKTAKQFFRVAVRKKWLSVSPFDDVKAGSQSNRSRDYFVERHELAKVLDACPDAEWRAVFVLSRIGGLRVPSELAQLTWDDVDWAHDRLHVRSPKTEHHEGKESRVIPLFPELRKYLGELFDQADPGVYVCPRYGAGRTNPITHARRIIKKAGLKPWPKTFHNMRASRETELAAEHPLHVVTEWIGNSTLIAAKHYLQVRDTDFDRAVQNPVQNVHAGPGSAPQTAPGANKEPREMPCFPGSGRIASWPPRPQTSIENAEKTADFGAGGAESGALALQIGQFDPDLQYLIDQWPALSDDLRAAILRMARNEVAGQL